MMPELDTSTDVQTAMLAHIKAANFSLLSLWSW